MILSAARWCDMQFHAIHNAFSPRFLLALVLPPLRAENVLFIGNSFTFGAMAPLVELNGGVPKLFEEIARAKGRDVATLAVTKGGKDWSYHLAQPSTAKALAARPWNWVVLQDLSTRPTRIGNIADFMRDGETVLRSHCGSIAARGCCALRDLGAARRYLLHDHRPDTISLTPRRWWGSCMIPMRA